MGSLDKRITELETGLAEQAKADAEAEMSPFERAHAEAVRLAPAEEVEEMERLLSEAEEWPLDPERDVRAFELWERMLTRVSWVWGAEARRMRDLLQRRLDGLERDWTAAGRQVSTWDSDREYWLVCTAAINRSHALADGKPAITDRGEAERIVRRIRSPGTTTEEALQLVGRR